MMTLLELLNDCWCATEVIVVDAKGFDCSVDPREQAILVTNSYNLYFGLRNKNEFGNRIVKSFGVANNTLVVEVE